MQLTLALRQADSALDVAAVGGVVLSLALGYCCSLILQDRLVAQPLTALRSWGQFFMWSTRKLEMSRAFTDPAEGLDTSEFNSIGRPLVKYYLAEAGTGEMADVADEDDGSAVGTLAHQCREAQLCARREVELGYRRFGRSMPNNAMAYVNGAQFFREHHRTNYMEMVLLAKASSLSRAVDVKYFVFERSHELQETSGGSTEDGRAANGGSLRRRVLTPIDRVRFEQLWMEGRSMQKATFRHLQSLWEAVQTTTPDLSHVQRIGHRLQLMVSSMEQQFANMLALNGDSPLLLRAYADFQLTIANRPAVAAECVNRADRIEEINNKDGNATMDHVQLGYLEANDFNLVDDTAASVTMAGDPAGIGEILSVSTSTCRMFGYSKSQMVGQNVGMLIPEPIRSVHDKFLRRYAQVGTAPRIGRPRVAFAQSKEGSIFPCYLCVKEAPPATNSITPRLVGVLRRIHTQENYMIIGGASDSFRVYSACASTHALIGVKADVLLDGHVGAAQWFPALAESYNDILTLPLVEGGGVCADPSRVQSQPAAALPRRATPEQPAGSAVQLGAAARSETGTDTVELGEVLRCKLAAKAVPPHSDIAGCTFRTAEDGNVLADIRLSSLQSVSYDTAVFTHIRGGQTADFAIVSLQRFDIFGKYAFYVLCWRPVPAHQVTAVLRSELGSVEGHHGLSPALKAWQPTASALDLRVSTAEDGATAHGSHHDMSLPGLESGVEFDSGVEEEEEGEEADDEEEGEVKGAAPHPAVPVAPNSHPFITPGARRDKRQTPGGASATLVPFSPNRVPMRGRVDSGNEGAEVQSLSSSRSTAMNPFNQLRRLLDKSNHRVEPEVRTMRRVLIVVMVCVLTVSSIVMGLFSAERDSMRVLNTAVARAGERLQTLHAVESTMAAMRLRAALPAAAVAPDHVLLAELEDLADVLDASHQATVAAAHSLSGRTSTVHTRQVVEILEPRPGGNHAVYSMTPHEAGTHMVTLVRNFVAKATIAGSVAGLDDGTDYRGFMMNLRAVHAPFNETLHALRAESIELSARYNQAGAWVYAAGCSFILLLCIATIVKSVRSLQRRCSDSLQVLLCLPKPVLRALRRHAQRRYEACIQQDMEDFEQHGEVDSLSIAPGGHQPGPAAQAADAEEEEVDWEALVRSIKRKHPTRVRETPSFRDSTRFVAVSTCKTVVPLLLIAAAAVLLLLLHSASSRAGIELTQRATVAHHMSTFSTRTTTTVVRLADASLAGMDQEQLMRTVDSMGAQLLRCNHVLLFGGPVPDLHKRHRLPWHLQPMVAAKPVRTLLAGDVCQWFVNQTDCPTIFGGILQHGLHDSLASYTSLARQLVFDHYFNSSTLYNATTDNALLETLLRMEKQVLRAAVPVTASLLLSSSDDAFSNAASQHILVSCLFLVAFTLFTLLVYWPQVESLAGALREAHMTLLNIPEPVAMGLMDVQERIAQIAQELDDETASLRRRASASSVRPVHWCPKLRMWRAAKVRPGAKA